MYRFGGDGDGDLGRDTTKRDMPSAAHVRKSTEGVQGMPISDVRRTFMAPKKFAGTRLRARVYVYMGACASTYARERAGRRASRRSGVCVHADAPRWRPVALGRVGAGMGGGCAGACARGRGRARVACARVLFARVARCACVACARVRVLSVRTRFLTWNLRSVAHRSGAAARRRRLALSGPS